MNGRDGLSSTLQAVVDGVVDGLGFAVAVVNYVHPDGTFETVAVAGSEDARAELLGRRHAADSFDVEFAVAEHWGALRFIPHDRLPADQLTGWIPPLEKTISSDVPDGWHPLDALFAPLTASSGELVGMLSVDLPRDGRRPGPLQRELLEMFATQAGIAIANIRLSDQLRAEHERLLAEQQHLAASEESFRLAFEGAGVGMTMLGVRGPDAGRFLRVNAAMCAITGYTAAELTARTFADITHPDDLGPDFAALGRAADGDEHVYRAEKRYVRKDGRPVWVGVTTTVVRFPSGEPLYAISQVQDITARRVADDDLTRRATQDPLTGLLNRSALRDKLAAALDQARAGGPSTAVLFCDLDGFKAVNDTHGHDTGDRVLAIAAARLAEQVREGDVIARLGGDEFVVLAENATPRDMAGITQLAERITSSLAGPMVACGIAVNLTVSIGIAVLDDHGPDVETVLRAADAAMYQAKASGRDRHVFSHAIGVA